MSSSWMNSSTDLPTSCSGCHPSWRSDDGVRVITAEPRRPRYETPVSGELLRALFEDKLDAREPEAA